MASNEIHWWETQKKSTKQFIYVSPEYQSQSNGQRCQWADKWATSGMIYCPWCISASSGPSWWTRNFVESKSRERPVSIRGYSHGTENVLGRESMEQTSHWGVICREDRDWIIFYFKDVLDFTELYRAKLETLLLGVSASTSEGEVTLRVSWESAADVLTDRK